MKIIVDVPDSLYANLQKIQNGSAASGRILKATQQGVVIAKQHGRLIDASQLFTVTECRPDGTVFTYVPYTSIENAESVIEADREVQDS